MWTLLVEDSDSFLSTCDLTEDSLMRECWECKVHAPDGREWEVDVDKHLAVAIVSGESDFDLEEWAGNF